MTEESYQVRWEREQAEHTEGSRKDAARLLRLKGIQKVLAVFSGSGDSGCIEEIEAFDKDGAVVELTDQEQDVLDLHFCLSLPGGWENNEGSDGELVMRAPRADVSGRVGWNVIRVEYENISSGLTDEELEQARRIR